MKYLPTLLAMSLIAIGSAAFAHGDDNHPARGGAAVEQGHASALGKPGDPNKVSRTVDITMSDAMRFNPASVSVKRNETIRFLLKNEGKLKHEMVLGTIRELKTHAALMLKFPGMEHVDPNQASVEAGQTGAMAYPTLSKNLHHEIELVACIGTGGKNIAAADAMKHVWGYAIGLDMTRRDLQGEAKKLGRPWDIGKSFDLSAPIGPIKRAAECSITAETPIVLEVNGTMRQQSSIGKLIWNIAEIIEHLSAAWELQPGDLIFSGTPEGVAAVERGDLLDANLPGVGRLKLRIV